jgi:predicted metal-dependent peptidase
MSDTPKEIQIQADQTAVLQRDFEEQVKTLKETETKLKATWKNVETAMIENNVKSIKGEWGSITIADRTNYKASDLEEVPRKFIKKALDTKKVQAHQDLTGELPKGVTESHTKYLTKRIK